jgi:hypothetical protein
MRKGLLFFVTVNLYVSTFFCEPFTYQIECLNKEDGCLAIISKFFKNNFVCNKYKKFLGKLCQDIDLCKKPARRWFVDGDGNYIPIFSKKMFAVLKSFVNGKKGKDIVVSGSVLEELWSLLEGYGPYVFIAVLGGFSTGSACYWGYKIIRDFLNVRGDIEQEGDFEEEGSVESSLDYS